MATLSVVCQQVIPRTDTPGAADVDTHGFIDNQLKHCHTAAQQQTARHVLEQIDRQASVSHSQRYVECSAAKQLALLDDLEGPRNGFAQADRQAFKFLKQLIVLGYFTSEVGASEVLRFDPYPGGFKGQVPFSEVGRAWFRHGW